MSDETTFHWPNVRRTFQDMAGDKDDSKTKCFEKKRGQVYS